MRESIQNNLMKKEKTTKEMCEYLFTKKKYKKIEIARFLGISHSVVHYYLDEKYRERHKIASLKHYTNKVAKSKKK